MRSRWERPPNCWCVRTWAVAFVLFVLLPALFLGYLLVIHLDQCVTPGCAPTHDDLVISHVRLPPPAATDDAVTLRFSSLCVRSVSF